MWICGRFGVEVVWAIGDCRHLSARLGCDLLTAGQKVVRVPPKLMVRARASARSRGEFDPIDALAGAGGLLREPDLPVASHDGVWCELKLLVDRREVLVARRAATINRLLWRVHALDPGHVPKARSLDLATYRLGDWLAVVPGLVAEWARGELADITRLTETFNAVATRIGQRVGDVAPVLLARAGCGELILAKLVGATAGVAWFKSAAVFAGHAGVAAVPGWSRNTAGRVRMTRSGNRRLNVALHRIAVTQIRLDGPGQAYYRHRFAAGDSTTEALRCLKRRPSRVVFGHLRTDHQNRIQPCQQAAP
jgi:transposase